MKPAAPAGPRRQLIAIGAFALIYVAIGMLVRNSYYQLMMNLVLIWAIVGLSWNVLSGYSGLVSFGQAAFFGLGGYRFTRLIIHATEEDVGFGHFVGAFDHDVRDGTAAEDLLSLLFDLRELDEELAGVAVFGGGPDAGEFERLCFESAGKHFEKAEFCAGEDAIVDADVFEGAAFEATLVAITADAERF